MKVTEELWKLQNNFKMVISTCLSIITLNVNGLKSPIKRHRVAEWVKKAKQDPSMCYVLGNTFRYKDRHRLRVKGWKKIVHASGNQKKDGSGPTFIRQNRL